VAFLCVVALASVTMRQWNQCDDKTNAACRICRLSWRICYSLFGFRALHQSNIQRTFVAMNGLSSVPLLFGSDKPGVTEPMWRHWPKKIFSCLHNGWPAYLQCRWILCAFVNRTRKIARKTRFAVAPSNKTRGVIGGLASSCRHCVGERLIVTITNEIF